MRILEIDEEGVDATTHSLSGEYERANGGVGAHDHGVIGGEDTDGLEEVQGEGGNDEVRLEEALRKVRQIQDDQ